MLQKLMPFKAPLSRSCSLVPLQSIFLAPWQAVGNVCIQQAASLLL